MKCLDRTRVPAPPCLCRYQHGRDNWGAVDASDKEEIQRHLDRLQGGLCAYCEGSLDVLGRHIEHLRQRSSFPKLTFEWENLFASCTQEDSCGRYKDNHAERFNPGDLLNPCDPGDDPDQFFRFRTDGTIDVRAGLAAREQHRARETLRVFNLDPDHGRLRSMRRRAVEAYQAVEPDICSALLEFSDEERRAFIREEIERTRNEPFSTVIRHLFLDLL
jgi:uncharacterized protein (TIGR02646 family)